MNCFIFSLNTTEQKSFLSLGEDFIIVNDKTIHLKGNILFHRSNCHFHLKLTEEKGVSNSVRTTRFWNNLNQVRSKSKGWKAK
jgi:hypothetical protein